MALRKMVYPYGFGDKIALFDYKHYWKNSWEFRYLILGYLVCAPIFYKIQKLSYSPVNVERFEKMKQKEKEEYEEHLKHLR